MCVCVCVALDGIEEPVAGTESQVKSLMSDKVLIAYKHTDFPMLV